MAATHVFDSPPPGVAADWTMPQRWEQFDAEEHRTWDRLAKRQFEAFPGRASKAFLAGFEALGVAEGGIPEFEALNERLESATGWRVVAVPGAIPNAPFFAHLAERRFPAANFLRSGASLDYSEEPDMFHDLFGHLPMLTNPQFADFMVAYGRAGLRAEALGAADFLGRLYLYTVEFGLVAEDGGLRAFGAGLLSSRAEMIHALESPDARRLRFDLPAVMRRNFLFDEYQQTYFVVDSYDELLRSAEETDFGEIYRELRARPALAPGARSPDDVPYVARG